jgi:hypothetical protein
VPLRYGDANAQAAASSAHRHNLGISRHSDHSISEQQQQLEGLSNTRRASLQTQQALGFPAFAASILAAHVILSPRAALCALLLQRKNSRDYGACLAEV